MRVVAGLDQRAAAVVIDEQVVRVAGEQQFGGALVLQLDRVAAIAVQDRADEIRALLRAARPPAAFVVSMVEAKRRSSGEDMRGDCS